LHDFVLSSDVKSLLFDFGRASTVQIPRDIEVICKDAFAGHRALSSLEFENDSRLRRIERFSFSFCDSLRSIGLPSSLETIDATAFGMSEISSIQIAEGNRHFRVSESFLLTFDGTSLILYFGKHSTVRIPREIEVICKGAFCIGKTPSMQEIEFETDSRLRRIAHKAFSDCRSVHSIIIPSFVDSIAGTAFVDSGIREVGVAEGNRHFRVSGEFLLRIEGNSLIRYFGTSQEVTVLNEIEGLSPGCFSGLGIRALKFENDSQLRQIDSQAFFRCLSLYSICIPSNVESIDGSAFSESGILEIRVADGNRHFRVSGECLTTSDGTSLIRYFGRDSAVKIGCDIERICTGSFSKCKQLQELEFESPSRVCNIECRAFEKCPMLESICLPASVEIICEQSFRKCKNLVEVRIEMGSKLRRIEIESFAGCSSMISLFVPSSVSGNEGLDLRGAAGVRMNWYE
jgi:hypothetical protein